MLLAVELHALQHLGLKADRGLDEHHVLAHAPPGDDDVPVGQADCSGVVVVLEGVGGHLLVEPLVLFDVVDEDLVLVAEEADLGVADLLLELAELLEILDDLLVEDQLGELFDFRVLELLLLGDVAVGLVFEIVDLFDHGVVAEDLDLVELLGGAFELAVDKLHVLEEGLVDDEVVVDGLELLDVIRVLLFF